MKETIKAYAIIWQDQADKSEKIDSADAHVCNECPSAEPTEALAIYSTKRVALEHKNSSREYRVVPVFISFKK